MKYKPFYFLKTHVLAHSPGLTHMAQPNKEIFIQKISYTQPRTQFFMLKEKIYYTFSNGNISI